MIYMNIATYSNTISKKNMKKNVNWMILLYQKSDNLTKTVIFIMEYLERITNDKIALLISFKSPVALHRLKTKYKIRNTEEFKLAAKYVANFLYSHHLEKTLYTASIETDGFIPRTELPRFVPLTGKISDKSSQIQVFSSHSIHSHHSHSDGHHHSHHHHHHSHSNSEKSIKPTNGRGEVRRPFFQFSEPELDYKGKRDLFLKRMTYVNEETEVNGRDLAKATDLYNQFIENRKSFQYSPPHKQESSESSSDKDKETAATPIDNSNKNEYKERDDQSSKRSIHEMILDEIESQFPSDRKSHAHSHSSVRKKKPRSPYKRKPKVIRISQSKDPN